MLIIKLISGLGNQLFQYAMGRQLSLKKGVPLKLDTSFFAGQQLRRFQLFDYNINATTATNKEIGELMDVYTAKSLYAKIYRKSERLIPKYKRCYYKESEWWIYDPEIFKITSNTYIDGYWQNYRYYESLNQCIIQELTLKDSTSAAYNKLKTEVEESRNSVSIHIRRSDYITDKSANQLHGVLPMEYYKRAVACMKQKNITPLYYIFSDDLNWVADKFKLDVPVKYVNTTGELNDTMELDIMSKCKHNIIANSSFSWWGAFLNQNHGKVVIAPSKWVVPEQINSKINLPFPSWIKL